MLHDEAAEATARAVEATARAEAAEAELAALRARLDAPCAGARLQQPQLGGLRAPRWQGGDAMA